MEGGREGREEGGGEGGEREESYVVIWLPLTQLITP